MKNLLLSLFFAYYYIILLKKAQFLKTKLYKISLTNYLLNKVIIKRYIVQILKNFKNIMQSPFLCFSFIFLQCFSLNFGEIYK